MKLYDTLTETRKELKKSFFRKLKFFVCGPTVYDTPHIGNARTFVAFDMFVRYVRSQGFRVSYLQNITDIDDKIIQRAQEEHVSWQELSKKYEHVFFENLKALNVTSVDTFARATEFIPEIIAQVQTLIKKGHAYKIEGDGWYFDLTTYADYGQLARRTVAQAEDGVTRIDNSEKKRNAGDFCLWKFSKEGEPSWKSDLGAGRPGWHIEDTAITEKFFGPQYDIHGGALDLKFPHHEAERAQQESASGKKPFVKIWMHAGFLTVNGQKMSKSLGNFMTVSDLLKKMTADEFRMMLLLHHYRSPLDYTEHLTHQARKNLSDIKAFLAKLALVNGEGTAFDLGQYEASYHAAMADDFNTPKAVAVLFDLMNHVSKDIWKFNQSHVGRISAFMETVFTDLGFGSLVIVIPEKIKKLAQDRELSRASKQFAQSDALRKEIEALGYIIEDTPCGPLVLPKSYNV